MRELNEMLTAQEEEMFLEFGEKQRTIIAENQRLSALLTEKFKVIDELTERLEKSKRKVADRETAPKIVGVLDCSPCMSDPVDITEQFDYSKIPCLGDDEVCVSCGS
jgi:uncharacterized coiled-coil protein SlyX